MNEREAIWREHQRRRWLRPNAHLYIRHDAWRFAPPGAPFWYGKDVARYFEPNLSSQPSNTNVASRPGTVAWTGKRDPASDRGAVLVFYGTTHLQIVQTGGIDLIIQNAQRLAELDLPKAVRFDLGLENWLPWASEFFAAPEHYLYIVAGPLNPAEINRLRTRLKR